MDEVDNFALLSSLVEAYTRENTSLNATEPTTRLLSIKEMTQVALRLTTYVKFVVYRVTIMNARIIFSILRMLSWDKQMLVKKNMSIISTLNLMINNGQINQISLT